ncbi:hypothetical protein BIU87_15360 [Streptomyces sp. ZS0098]|nr:hypothetical protein BIU87_15360 [Streptomyces sp. ZS0098]
MDVEDTEDACVRELSSPASGRTTSAARARVPAASPTTSARDGHAPTLSTVSGLASDVSVRFSRCGRQGRAGDLP